MTTFFLSMDFFMNENCNFINLKIEYEVILDLEKKK